MPQAANSSTGSTTNRYEIFAEWRFRYAPGVTHNTEHVFSLCLPEPARSRSPRRAPRLSLAALEGSGRGLLFLE
jgi:hypothetical protein